ncbi:hypothetical protein HUG15_19440 [Salicibibacter cibarius]|uniref:Uncharacterized protein n=1 Tax=Salicibibacter cibarius TaxID=2743000 RepID=A0A7T7CD20_9BACI|nr:hypothetical protein [Salicibibacter cibarius]QQK77538.1 hypothetical protein HUG15_19440 [Salicibibacter cibarius]
MAGLYCNYCEEKIPYRTRAKKRFKDTKLICPHCYRENELDKALVNLSRLIFYVTVSFSLAMLVYGFSNNLLSEPLFTFYLGLIPAFIYPLLTMFLIRVDPE